MSTVIEKLISFIKWDEENGELSSFNRYFLDKMPTVLEFFDN